jgi:uncharacterized membrane protein
MNVLIAVVRFWFWLERTTRWKLFEFLPPLIFIYATPVLLSYFSIIPFKSGAYDCLRQYGMPVLIVLMLIKVDVFVMRIGTVGVVVGGVLAYTPGQTIQLRPTVRAPSESDVPSKYDMIL